MLPLKVICIIAELSNSHGRPIIVLGEYEALGSLAGNWMHKLPCLVLPEWQALSKARERAQASQNALCLLSATSDCGAAGTSFPCSQTWEATNYLMKKQ